MNPADTRVDNVQSRIQVAEIFLSGEDNPGRSNFENLSAGLTLEIRNRPSRLSCVRSAKSGSPNQKSTIRSGNNPPNIQCFL